MIGECDKCGRSNLVVIKNKRKETKVYCEKCGKLLRFADKNDKNFLRIMCGK